MAMALLEKQDVQEWDVSAAKAAAGIPYEHIHWTLDDITKRYRVGAGVELLFLDETKHLFCEDGISPDARPGLTFDGFSYSISAQPVTP